MRSALGHLARRKCASRYDRIGTDAFLTSGDWMHRSWQCPLDGRVLSQREFSEHSAAWCPRCTGVWLPGSVSVAVLKALATRERIAPALSHVFDGHRCPEDAALLSRLKDHGDMLETCGTCGGLWLSGTLLREYRAQQSADGTQRGGPWNPSLSPVQLAEPLSDLSALIASAAEAAGLTAADLIALLSELFSGA
jgi:Zn-finger nucleic acid-binding protein